MRILASITAVLLFLFLLTSAPAFSQEGTDRPDHPQDEKAKDKDKERDKDRAEPRQNDNTRQDENKRDESRPEARPQEQTRPEERRDEHTGRPQEQTRPEGQVRQENRGQQRQRVAGDQGGGQGHRGQRIPDDRFRSSFGREHHFHVDRARIINQAQPEFVYGGYNFQLAEPWPAEWSFDDDCYIDYVDDDYYLYDAYHPGIRILVFVIG
jgi:type IV secretory pathway VirB10-like protein